jgi:hypothetical protein
MVPVLFQNFIFVLFKVKRVLRETLFPKVFGPLSFLVHFLNRIQLVIEQVRKCSDDIAAIIHWREHVDMPDPMDINWWKIVPIVTAGFSEVGQEGQPKFFIPVRLG